ncbi:MAG TPA: hypothetical protein VK335_22640 [Bryobacteraceae bacterium]|nr:hypothetical protein [Bryobacteraceae bacterium]
MAARSEPGGFGRCIGNRRAGFALALDGAINQILDGVGDLARPILRERYSPCTTVANSCDGSDEFVDTLSFDLLFHLNLYVAILSQLESDWKALESLARTGYSCQGQLAHPRRQTHHPVEREKHEEIRSATAG